MRAALLLTCPPACPPADLPARLPACAPPRPLPSAQAIDSLVPVRCRLLDYGVSSITEVGGWLRAWVGG